MRVASGSMTDGWRAREIVLTIVVRGPLVLSISIADLWMALDIVMLKLFCAFVHCVYYLFI